MRHAGKIRGVLSSFWALKANKLRDFVLLVASYRYDSFFCSSSCFSSIV